MHEGVIFSLAIYSLGFKWVLARHGQPRGRLLRPGKDDRSFVLHCLNKLVRLFPTVESSHGIIS
jgi:hypothetical protein